MNQQEKLQQPFEASEIEWRVQRSGIAKGKGWAMVLAYVNNRAIMDRLDEVFGIDGWKNEYSVAPDGGILCGISALFAGEWVTKYDGAENTQVEAVKGGLSNAMKRAAVQWGIGRYLYKLEATFVQVQPNGKNRIKVDDKYTGETITGYWDLPKLPEWALPSETETKSQ
jgi:hypothetical protein